jgi:formiminotetrahydrofolate cyclodeaminase
MPDRPAATTPLNDRTIGAYLDALGSAAPTPGGGSAAGVLGALGASLGLMVVALTGTDDDAGAQELRTAETTLQELRDRFTRLAEEDEAVYQAYRDAAALPKGTPEDKAARREAMQRALKNAATIPLHGCEASAELAAALVPVQQHGNPHLLSDARIAMLCATACFEASRVNVNVNLAMIRDDAWVQEVSNRVDALASSFQDTQPV